MTEERRNPQPSDSNLTPEQYRRIQDLVEEVGGQPADQRRILLRRALGAEPVLLQEAIDLLRAQESLDDSEESGRDLQAGDVIGAYRVVRELGRGGMGCVYLAVRADGAYDTQVAIKVVQAGPRSDEVVARFKRERRILASLDHANIARLLDAGTLPDERPYFVMEHVPGRSITDYADLHGLSVTDRVRLFITACGAVEYAHQKQVVHRDIKPSNILVTDDGVPKLLDFGIATSVDRDRADPARLTATGMAPGTPRYASPEQLEGAAVDYRTDVYGLGVVLFELLAGWWPSVAEGSDETPFRPSDAIQAPPAAELRPGLQRAPAASGIARARRTTPQALIRQLRGDLDAIVCTALCRDPSARYQTAQDLIEDLRRFLAKKPVHARGLAAPYRLWSFARRHGFLIAATLFLVLLVPVAVLLKILGGAKTEVAGTGVVTQQVDPIQITKIGGGLLDLDSAAFSSDGRFMAFRRTDGDRIVLRHLESGRDTELLPAVKDVTVRLFSPDGSYIYFSSFGDGLFRMPVVGGQPEMVLRAGIVWGMTFSPDGARIAVSALTNPEKNEPRFSGLWIAGANGAQPHFVADFGKQQICCPAWSPDGKSIAVFKRAGEVAVHTRGVLLVLDAETGIQEQALDPGLTYPISLDDFAHFLDPKQVLAWAPDGSGLLVSTASLQHANVGPDIWFVPWPTGPARRITADSTMSYSAFTPQASGNDILTLRAGKIGTWRVTDLRLPDRSIPSAIRCDEGDNHLSALLNGRMMCWWDAGIFTMNVDGSDRVRLPTPNGTEIWLLEQASHVGTLVFTGNARGDFRTKTLWQIDEDGSNLRPVPNGNQKVAKALSPDGSVIYYSQWPEAGPRKEDEVWEEFIKADLWTMPLVGGPSVRVGKWEDIVPRFSRSGRYFYLYEGRDPKTNVVHVKIMTTAANQSYRTLEFGAAEYFVGWAPTEDAVLSVKDVNGVKNIWRTPVDGRPPVAITRFGFGGLGTAPVLTADGTKLVFWTTEDLPFEIVRITGLRAGR